MNAYYNQTTAHHYAAYRPPLHSIILEKVLPEDSMFAMGLDVGCGTGYSTLALANYCKTVTGIDPSQSMLARSLQHPGVNYLQGSAEEIPLPDHSIDIATFAGSLFYTDRNHISVEIRRVCKTDALIIPYDFELLLDEPINMLDLDHPQTEIEYDHTINFSGMDGFKEMISEREQVTIECTGTQLAHLLLSDADRYDIIAEKYRTENPFDKLEEILRKVGNHFFVKANLFYSKYQLTEE
ncbi:class I SAM-dependent methyltransferase [Rhodohalobacter sulfatireducens]|uniref:Class I SAM-dependent methyltransferase n=1 Tax=Rhodohalobacter sulfatireducens TaxID=2911366 RepID=A0ABS9KDJ2_9BACT|nr:class I SAM-dependent methyltransferase [Rhodohalobacter sulfatireducens]MCG2588934.1 class I SAM-dependent methyltransferase [Rhodohalobacter sulfatireducens]